MTELLACCKELRDALAIAMQVCLRNKCSDELSDAIERHGIKPGIGVRAQVAIDEAEHLGEVRKAVKR
jgi:hypothetical protein